MERCIVLSTFVDPSLPRDQVLFKIAPSPGVRHGYVSRFQALVQGCQQRRLVVPPGSNQCPRAVFAKNVLDPSAGEEKDWRFRRGFSLLVPVDLLSLEGHSSNWGVF